MQYVNQLSFIDGNYNFVVSHLRSWQVMKMAKYIESLKKSIHMSTAQTEMIDYIWLMSIGISAYATA